MTGPHLRANAAYLAVVSADLMFGDPELHLFVELLATAMWMVPGRHLGTYCIASVSRESVFSCHPRTVRDLFQREKEKTTLVLFHPNVGSVRVMNG